MFRKSFTLFLFIAAVLIAGHSVADAQNVGPAGGKVELQKADGTREPVAGALVEVFRTDIKSGSPPAKTNKKGEFRFVGFLLGARYALSVSAPNCEPQIFPDVKAGQENLVITLSPGDGKKWTEAEVRKAVADGVRSDAGEPAEVSAADKKAKADYDKAVADNEAARKKAIGTHTTVNTVLKEGAAALEAKNYDLAIAKFDEGYQADPDFEGSAPVLLTNKAIALRERGIATFRTGAAGDASAKAAAMQKAKEDYAQASIAFEKAIQILEKAPSGDTATKAKLDVSKTSALKHYVILHGSMARMRLDPAKAQEAVPILDRYLAIETNDLEKMPVAMTWANYMREAGETKNAMHVYRIVLAKTPDSVDALAGLGLSLFAEGVGSSPENKEQMQEGLNLMQKFADTAPDTHPLKASVKESVDYLKDTAKLAPQKVTPQKAAPPKKRN